MPSAYPATRAELPAKTSSCASGAVWGSTPRAARVKDARQVDELLGLHGVYHRIGLWENLQESPMFDGKNHGFL